MNSKYQIFKDLFKPIFLVFAFYTIGHYFSSTSLNITNTQINSIEVIFVQTIAGFLYSSILCVLAWFIFNILYTFFKIIQFLIEYFLKS